MMRQLQRAYRVVIRYRFSDRPASVDAVTEGAALELVEQINKTGSNTAVYLGAIDAAQGAAVAAAYSARQF